MMQSISNKVISRIYGHGRGWAFTQKDFIDCGSYAAVRQALSRLRDRGFIRQLLRGVYDYPRTSKIFKGPASPDPDQIAQAIARGHAWSIYASGETALNLLGLSTQVPGKYRYFTDGPSKTYSWNAGEVFFLHRSIRETTRLSPRTSLVVQALKTLGKENVNQKVIRQLGRELTSKEKKAALQEAKYATAWVYEVIKKVPTSKTLRQEE